MLRRIVLTFMLLISFSAPTSAQVFGGAGFNQGVLISTNFLGESETTAEIDAAGIVRLTDDRAITVLPVVEGHLLYPVSDNLGLGPFVAAALGDEIINAIGGGVVVGFRDGDDSINLGFGVWLTPKARVLRREFVVDAPVPMHGDVPLPIAYTTQGTVSFAVTITFNLL